MPRCARRRSPASSAPGASAIRSRVEAALAALEQVAARGEGNLLAAAVEAARARATVGEISDAMRRVFGDHAAVPEVVDGRLWRGL